LKGKTLLKEGRDAEALACFQQALQLDPNNSRSLAYVAQVLASNEKAQFRDGRTALILAEKANTLTNGRQTATLDALAMAYAELGQFDAAQQVAQYALTVAQARNLKEDYAILQRRLQLYQNHQPFRQSFTNAPAQAPPKN